MIQKVLAIINDIRASKDLPSVAELNPEMKLREDLGLTSFDLAELTVKIEDEFDIDIFEDGLVTKIGEIFEKLS
ncbi:MAG: phosphopantetheine-binding protein [Bacteroidales bacterium]|nr:phosphopantetheine-binding protein [Bacteroidales bacterium]